MKKTLKVFFIFIVVCMLTITIISIYKYYDLLNIPKIKTSSMEYGSTTNEAKSEKNYKMYYISYSSENEFLNTKIKDYIDSSINTFIKDNKTQDYVVRKDKAVFLQVLDSYKVNDDIIGIKIITKIKMLKNSNYNTEITTFNCCIKDNKEITLDDLFKYGYKEKIADIYTDKYLLTSKNILFFNRRR